MMNLIRVSCIMLISVEALKLDVHEEEGIRDIRWDTRKRKIGGGWGKFCEEVIERCQFTKLMQKDKPYQSVADERPTNFLLPFKYVSVILLLTGDFQSCIWKCWCRRKNELPQYNVVFYAYLFAKTMLKLNPPFIFWPLFSLFTNTPTDNFSMLRIHPIVGRGRKVN